MKTKTIVIVDRDLRHVLAALNPVNIQDKLSIDRTVNKNGLLVRFAEGSDRTSKIIELMVPIEELATNIVLPTGDWTKLLVEPRSYSLDFQGTPIVGSDLLSVTMKEDEIGFSIPDPPDNVRAKVYFSLENSNLITVRLAQLSKTNNGEHYRFSLSPEKLTPGAAYQLMLLVDNHKVYLSKMQVQ